jgi:hypothetical protein
MLVTEVALIMISCRNLAIASLSGAELFFSRCDDFWMVLAGTLRLDDNRDFAHVDNYQIFCCTTVIIISDISQTRHYKMIS